MLGIGRASEYAGWWSGKPSFTSTSRVASTTLGQFNGFSSVLATNPWRAPVTLGDPATYAFDNTGIVSARAQVSATTVRFDVMSNYTWATDPYRSGYQFVKNTSGSTGPAATALYPQSNTGTQYCDSRIGALCRTTTTNKFAIFGSPNGYDYIPFTSSFDSLANTWITIILAQAPTTSSFAGWTGGTPGTNFYPVRACIVNSQTGVLIEKVDINLNQFQGQSTTYASETWYPYVDNTGPGTAYFYNYLQSFDPGYNPTPNFYQASYWSCLGQVFDPTAGSIPNYKYLCGSNLPGTVGGVQSWINLSSAGNATTGSYTALVGIGPGRTTQTSNYGWANFTTSVSAPYQSTTIRP